LAQPAHSLPAFTWATGIEDTFVTHARPGMRSLDEYALTQHYQQWRGDFARAVAAGATAIRWGLPWHRVQPRPGEWDWRWTDQVLDYAVSQRGLTVILDLLHYGTPLWLENSFLNAHYPARVAAYTRAVAARYHSLVRHYTPCNEPALLAHWCGRRAEWPPYLAGDDGFVKLALAVARGMALSTQTLLGEQPGAVTVQVEAVGRFRSNDPALAARVERHNHEQYLCFDLATGRVGDDYPLAGFLAEHGVTAGDLAWFRQNAVRFDIFGANFYPGSYGLGAIRRDGLFYRRPGSRTPGAALAQVLREVYARYELPIFVTETSALGGVERRARWMDETVSVVAELRQAGVPVVGYTWFPLFTLFDWSYRLGRRPLADYALHLGLYDCAFDSRGTFRRRATQLVSRFRRHAAQPMPTPP
jgi:beta-glucosidase/6-phospho-beta-glucosidase/beta-galactosidase